METDPSALAVRAKVPFEAVAFTDAAVSLVMFVARADAMLVAVEPLLKLTEFVWLFTVTLTVPASKIAFFPPVKAPPEVEAVNEGVLKWAVSRPHEADNT